MAITADKLDWLWDVNVFMTPISHTNWNTNTVNTSAIRNGFRVSSGAQNDATAYDVTLAAGTWSIEVLHVKGTDTGTYSVQLGGVEKGTIDGYNGSTTYNNRTTISSIAVASTGKVRLSLVMATKNASSSSYYGRIQHIQLRRTA